MHDAKSVATDAAVQGVFIADAVGLIIVLIVVLFYVVTNQEGDPD